MFTGLIEDVGRFREWRGAEPNTKIVIESALPLEQIVKGESIAVNGACLTVEEVFPAEKLFTCHVLRETIDRTNLQTIQSGVALNLERALPAQGRFGGHFVTGHVDATARIKSIYQSGNDKVCEIYLPDELKPLVIPKGSITVDGISLTIASLADSYFSIHVIPWTSNHTNICEMKQGDAVNLETDIIGKYVLRQQTAQSKDRMTLQNLYDAGFY